MKNTYLSLPLVGNPSEERFRTSRNDTSEQVGGYYLEGIMKRFCSLILFILFSIFLPAYTFADTTYIVKKGDSLYKISKKLGVPVKDIKTKNNIASNRIKPGIKLQIPEQDKKQDVSDTAHLQPMGVKPKL